MPATSQRPMRRSTSLVRRAGGIVLGKTVTTEFAHLDPGKTRNPHNLAHTPGGSSSGSAAAVAAGMLPIALGSQTGGSVIRPASYCGVAGFKPSYRLIPTVGMKCFSWHLDTVGVFAASVADAAFAAEAITGRAAARRRHGAACAADRRAAPLSLAGGERRDDDGARDRDRAAPRPRAPAVTEYRRCRKFAPTPIRRMARSMTTRASSRSPTSTTTTATGSDLSLRVCSTVPSASPPEAYDSARRTTHRARDAINGAVGRVRRRS